MSGDGAHLLKILSEVDTDTGFEIDLGRLTKSSRLSLPWRCANNHAYVTSVHTRVRTGGCKLCKKEENWNRIIKAQQTSGRWARLIDRALPEVLEMWDQQSNRTSIEDVSAGSHVKYRWKCPLGHVWEASPNSLINGRRCPTCAKNSIGDRVRKASVRRSGSLYDAQPDLRSQWDPENTLTMHDVSAGSNTKVKWICSYNHKWEATVNNRVALGSGCPYCTNQTSKLEIYLLVQLRSVFRSVLWRSKIGGKEVDILLPEQNLGIEVDGEYWHRNKVDADLAKELYFKSNHNLSIIRVRPVELEPIGIHTVNFRRGDTQQKIALNLLRYINALLPDAEDVDSYIKIGAANNLSEYATMIAKLPAPVDGNSLADLYPRVADEWDDDLNRPLTPSLFSPGSDQKVFWRCLRGHSFEASIKNRVARSSGCPHCQIALQSNRSIATAIKRIGSIADKAPHLLPYWDIGGNEGNLPDKVPFSLHKTFAWRCLQGHTFRRQLKTMMGGAGCPVCCSIRFSSPLLYSEWDFEKNGELKPEETQPGSIKFIWWRCENGHSWGSTAAARTFNGKKCLSCRSVGFLYPQLLQEWDEDRNQGKDPYLVSSGSDERIWWKCAEGHHWQSTVSTRTNRNSGCPACSKFVRGELVRVQKLKKSGSLAEKYPEVAKWWHPTLNGDVSATDFSSNSHRLFWWVCRCGSAYERSPNNAVTIWKRRAHCCCGRCASKKPS